MMKENKTNIYISLHDEIIKLLTIVNGDKFFSAKYLKEKLERALTKWPIVLYPTMVAKYEKLKKEFKEK